MQKLITLAALLFSVFVTVIIYHANTDGSMAAMSAVRSVRHGDKLAHFLLFGILGFLLNLALRCATWAFASIRIYQGTALVLLFAVVEECSQHFISRRMFDLHDLLADILGLLFFTFITFQVAGYRSSQVSSHCD